MRKQIILSLLILFLLFSGKVFSQVNDSISSQQLKYRVGIGIFSIPGFYLEKNITEKISCEAGVISCFFFNEASVGLKHKIYEKKNFKIKGGIGCGMTASLWWAKTDPASSGQDIYVLPSIPIEFILKKISLELQPGYPIPINGSDDAKIPIIVFLSYIIN